MLESIKYVSNMADVSFVIQEEPLGLGHAVLTARDAVGDEPFVVILPDDIIDHRPGVISQMLEVSNQHDGGVIAVEQVPWEVIHNYGVVDADDRGQSNAFRQWAWLKSRPGRMRPPT